MDHSTFNPIDLKYHTKNYKTLKRRMEYMNSEKRAQEDLQNRRIGESLVNSINRSSNHQLAVKEMENQRKLQKEKEKQKF
mmetsp:Transcript_18420/g.17540  ORF Transcript_18420/g.17540 Transcript_18420/m.17540 type:complete len:80 (-) Transcript_18420:156-395(-)